MKNYQRYNGSNLAYIGDAYYELMVRNHLLASGITKSNDLKKRSLSYVTATAHLLIYEQMKDIFTEEEQKIYLRGRNGAPSGHRKHMDRGAYVVSSGLEAVIGYLYLKADFERLNHLFQRIFQVVEGETL